MGPYRISYGEANLDIPLSKAGLGGGGGGATTVANGGDATQGATADAAVDAGATGTISAKLRRISADIGSVLNVLTTFAVNALPGILTLASDLIPAVKYGAPTSAVGRVTSDVTQVLVSAARPTRRALTIKNTDDSFSAFVGGTGVTAVTGFPLGPGEGITITVTHAIYCITDSGSPVVAFFEEYD